MTPQPVAWTPVGSITISMSVTSCSTILVSIYHPLKRYQHHLLHMCMTVLSPPPLLLQVTSHMYTQNLSDYRLLCMHVLQSLPEKSIVLFHACAHNPTGVDPKVRMYNALCCLMSSCC